jgi:predicted transcriptional regulator
MYTDTKVIISSQVSASVRERLAELATQADRTLSAEIRRAVDQHVQAADHEEEQ